MTATNPSPLTTLGVTPFSFHSDQPLFRVNSGVPLHDALRHVSDLLHVAKLLAEDAAMTKETDRYAWASHYLQEMSKAVIDDVVRVLVSPCHAGQ
ncbi:DUF3077 domain-containing protein [Pseudomonas tolaasii]|uniref:DUF3077 domain-containing protein n=2 Tax=Pseudomonas tolaasii TaxID=29442 RepID=A0A7Y8DQB4_PSETO|nr:DUF3077 domain-containing protein [Pseudomonas tolaasii]ARB29743.1 hypothetical protein B5P22_21415 [Pseudomonas tolaasii]KAB0468498.1 DUF3077 domain-containing protein [Pseudomonas tolaasii]MBY8941272.1 DUF3077 domain-containing protein [Pseudomonas tolaasii]NVZ43695.1 DUF3077 domain-containing protein [Pseudomonas tolaasii]NWA49403.1 DUF3077 domain-containing protein [Pseudomonas tolaasii]